MRQLCGIDRPGGPSYNSEHRLFEQNLASHSMTIDSVHDDRTLPADHGSDDTIDPVSESPDGWT